MRKGRSSRRSRISRPLVSVKGEALSTDIGPASSGGLPSPRVVVGVPASEPPPSESIETPPPVSLETKAPSTTRSITSILRGSIVDREEHLPPPPSEPPVDEPVAKSESELVVAKSEPEPVVAKSEPEPVVAKSESEPEPTVLAKPEPPPEPVVAKAEPEPAVPPPAKSELEPAAQSASSLLAATMVDAAPPVAKVDFAATIVQGSSEVEKVESKKEPAPASKEKPFAKTLAFGSKINELPQSERVETPKAIAERKEAARERLKTQRDKAQEAQKAVSPKEDPDEISVPPVNDINVEDEKFFSDAEVAVRKSHHEFLMMAQQEQEELVPEKARRKLDPHVIRRREKFVGYVKIAVAGAAIVCLAAVGRSAIHSRTKTAQASQAAIAAAPETPPAAPVAPVAEKAAEPAAAPVAPVAETKPAEAAPATPEPAASAEPAKEEITGDAKEELKKSRVALEKRKIPEAIEAGERAVALDPTDGEAWLILGASYQEKGDLVNARRCYSACVKQGKSGPRLECQKMLRF